ncbi:MAG: accessory factor UbiK family protein [Porticoccaceae bacterium]|nr:accessory factor UbiK family protein [Porticoccaceae bacterium]
MNSDDFYNSLKSQLEQAATGAQALNTEAWPHLRVAINNLFDKLEVLTREEFDAQNAVLMRSRAKIDLLEEQLLTLEQSMQNIK